MLEEEGRRRVWRLYGWFCGLVLCGSCFGAVAWTAWMRYLQLSLDVPSPNPNQLLLDYSHNSALVTSTCTEIAQFLRCIAVYTITYKIEFVCLSFAKLLVLDRLLHVAVPKSHGMPRRLVIIGWSALAIFSLGHVAGLCGCIASATFFSQSADSVSDLLAALAANSTGAVTSSLAQVAQRGQRGLAFSSLESFIEVCLLVIVIITFVIVGAMCARRMSSALLHLPSEASNASSSSSSSSSSPPNAHLRHSFLAVRRQILCTVAVIFATFLLRAVYTFMFALSSIHPSDYSVLADCNNGNDLTHMHSWILQTPEFGVVTELISSPLTLLVALWGMTSRRALQLMAPDRQQACEDAPLADRF